MRDLLNNFGKRRHPCLFVIDFEHAAPFVESLDECAGHDVIFSIRGRTNAVSPVRPACRVQFTKKPVSYAVYKRAFDTVRRELAKGNSYLVNLTFPTPITTNLELEEIYFASQAPYKLLFKNQFVVFSPEQFVEIKENRIGTFPMKGTIDASIPRAREKILADEKEAAEHITVVDLLRNDLGIVAKRVRVERLRYIETVRTHEGALLQVSSEIKGELEGDWQSRLGDIMANLLPAGSVTGAPKKKTLQIIREAETYRRGFYTGIFGIFDGESVDSAVMIRFIERDGAGGLVFKSGGGITIDSDPEREYREMVEKVYVPIA